MDVYGWNVFAVDDGHDIRFDRRVDADDRAMGSSRPAPEIGIAKTIRVTGDRGRRKIPDECDQLIGHRSPLRAQMNSEYFLPCPQFE